MSCNTQPSLDSVVYAVWKKKQRRYAARKRNYLSVVMERKIRRGKQLVLFG